LYITPTNATDSATSGLTSIPYADNEAGRGELNNAASWDDFPNGRFGDYKSPAFGDQGPWGGVGISVRQLLINTAFILMPCLQRSEAFEQWGHPKTVDDLTHLFLRHLHSKIATTPFSSSPLYDESSTILPHLERLTRKGWWTVGSQPTVDGVTSADEVFGWGPRGGYVFQKAFVEFFADKEDVEKIEKKVSQEGKGLVDYFAGNVQVRNVDEFRVRGLNNLFDDRASAGVMYRTTGGMLLRGVSSPDKRLPRLPSSNESHSYHGRSEPSSFHLHGSDYSYSIQQDEAFSIWAEWASFYRPGSDERSLLDSIQNERWLVSIVHHDFKDPEGLWTFLFEGIPVP
jgi:methylenetetrahydrofolate reductase (NADPH)